MTAKPKPLPKKIENTIALCRKAPWAVFLPQFRHNAGLLDDYNVPESIKKGVPRYLTDPQQKFAQSPAIERWFIAANRAGKTFLGALEMAWYMQGSHPFRKIPEPPNEGWAGFPDFKNHGRPITVPLLKWAFGKIGVEYKRAADKFEVQALNGKVSTCYLKSYDSGADKWQGAAPDIIWFDEVPEDQAIYDEAMMRIGDSDLNIIGTMTPLYKAAWLYSEVYERWKDEGEDPLDKAFISSSIYENVHLSARALKKAEKQVEADPDTAKIRLHGEWAHISGRIYGELSPFIHRIADFEIPGVHRQPNTDEGEEPWTLYRAIDVGIRNNSVVLWIAVSPDGLCYVYRELCESDKSIPTMCDIALAMETPIEKATGFEYSVIDPSSAQRDPATGTARVDTYANNGIICIKGNNDWQLGVSKMKDAFHYKVDDDGNMVSPPKYRFFQSCRTTWDEHRKYAYAQHSRTSVTDPREAANKRDDHTVDSLRYLEATGMGPDFRKRQPDSYSYADLIYEEDTKTGY